MHVPCFDYFEWESKPRKKNPSHEEFGSPEENKKIKFSHKGSVDFMLFSLVWVILNAKLQWVKEIKCPVCLGENWSKIKLVYHCPQHMVHYQPVLCLQYTIQLARLWATSPDVAFQRPCHVWHCWIYQGLKSATRALWIPTHTLSNTFHRYHQIHKALPQAVSLTLSPHA